MIFRYIRALLRDVPLLKPLIDRETADIIDLNNSISIEVHTASFRSPRGYAVVAALLDEVAYWPTDDFADPDYAILEAIRPAMAQFPDAMLLCASSPYGRRGALYDAWRKHYGQTDHTELVWQAATLDMNKTVSAKWIAKQYEDDPASAAAEYGGEFRSDAERLFTAELVQACVVEGRRENPPDQVSGSSPIAVIDFAGGSGTDSMTLCIAHKSGDRVIIDLLRERQPPFSPETALAELATVLRSYNIFTVKGDRFGGEWPRERFRIHGIDYQVLEQSKSDLYRDMLPVINSGRVELLDHARCLNQLIALERRTARGGRDLIDHPPGPGSHDDLANVCAAATVLLTGGSSSAEGWIAWAAKEVATAGLPTSDNDAPEPFYLHGNRKFGTKAPPTTSQTPQTFTKKHPDQPIELTNNPVANAYWESLSKAQGYAQVRKTCACCGADTEVVGSRLADGQYFWCHEGCRQQWARGIAEKNKARAVAENGGLPLTQPAKRTSAAEAS